MIAEHYLQDVLHELHKYREMAEKALAQVPDEQFFAALDPESNSLALIVKHMAGNMRSRWTDFLTSDGEKPSRERDREFLLEEGDSRASLMAQWADGWARTLAAIEALQPDDLQATVTIRGKPHTVLQAINRQLTHYASHVGQMVLLAKHFAGERWQTLSIPRGRSRDFDVAKDGSVFQA